MSNETQPNNTSPGKETQTPAEKAEKPELSERAAQLWLEWIRSEKEAGRLSANMYGAIRTVISLGHALGSENPAAHSDTRIAARIASLQALLDGFRHEHPHEIDPEKVFSDAHNFITNTITPEYPESEEYEINLIVHLKAKDVFFQTPYPTQLNP